MTSKRQDSEYGWKTGDKQVCRRLMNKRSADELSALPVQSNPAVQENDKPGVRCFQMLQVWTDFQRADKHGLQLPAISDGCRAFGGAVADTIQAEPAGFSGNVPGAWL